MSYKLFLISVFFSLILFSYVYSYLTNLKIHFLLVILTNFYESPDEKIFYYLT